ncbi:MAG: SIS domain-containing protein [Thermoplasmata archaeon]
MSDMIRREPVAVQETLRTARESASDFPSLPPEAPLYLIGQGTSFHAALATEAAAQRWLGLRRAVRALPSLDALVYEDQLDAAGFAIVFSASGETAVTIRAQETLTSRGIPHLLITHSPTSTSAHRATQTLATRNAEEESWTHTVSYQAAIVAALAVFESWSDRKDAIEPRLTQAATLVKELVDRENEVRAIAEAVLDRSKILLLGSGPAFATVREAALKIREASGRFSATVGVEEALHGPMPAVDDATALIALTLKPFERERGERALHAATLAGARAILLTRGEPGGEFPTFLLPPIDPELSPLIDIVPLQWFAYWTGVLVGRNPDIMGLEIPRIFAARSSFGI